MLFFRRKKAKRGLARKTISIQASYPEGSKEYVMIESMLTGIPVSVAIPGITNAYRTYEVQVAETYRKYNSFADFGSQQLRTIVDLRTAFIGGEGISISCQDERTAAWIEPFLRESEMTGANFVNAVKGAEMSGQSLFLLKRGLRRDGSVRIKISRVPYVSRVPYKVVYSDVLIRDRVADIQVKKEGMWVSSGFRNFIYIRTGGDDTNSQGPVTKVGVVLTDIENYDRAIKDMRRNNHIFARVTPTWEVGTDSEAKALIAKLAELRWKIGNAFIGKAKFDYKVPKTGAHENLTYELVATIKTISSTTGVPVHWLGYVDLMSNRATAQTLYELIKNATLIERVLWERSLYDMIVKGQELYIDAGGEGLSRLNYDFEVKLPLIDFSDFLDRVKALNLAFTDEAISIDDYRNMLPGIDPLKTRKAVEKSRKEDRDQLVKMGLPKIKEGE